MNPEDHELVRLIQSIMAQGGVGVAIPHIIEFLKGPNGPRWIRFDTSRINRIVSWVVAIAAGIGITWTGSLEAGFTIGIPPLAQWGEALTRIMLAKGIQQIYFQHGIKGAVVFSPRPSSERVSSEGEARG
jgi:hypothetical protein